VKGVGATQDESNAIGAWKELSLQVLLACRQALIVIVKLLDLSEELVFLVLVPLT